MPPWKLYQEFWWIFFQDYAILQAYWNGDVNVVRRNDQQRSQFDLIKKVVEVVLAYGSRIGVVSLVYDLESK